MAKYNVGDKVLISGTVVSLTSDETGVYYDVKIKANNKLTSFHCEEEDLEEKTDSTTSTEDTTSDTPEQP